MDKEIRFNIKAHNKIALAYEDHHTQIFNSIEQNRIHEHLSMAMGLLLTTSLPKQAFDFGCGSGNISRHLLALDFGVTAADVAEAFLRLVEKRFGSGPSFKTLQLNGTDLVNVSSDSFDLTVAYAVLHHIPAYLPIVQELIRITKPGGIIMLDREAAPSVWNANGPFQAFQASLPKTNPKLPGSRFLKFETYLNRWRRYRNPRFQVEGDIHIWADDHIDWDALKALFLASGCEILCEEEYLSYDSKYPMHLYEEYRERCADDKWILARKSIAAI